MGQVMGEDAVEVAPPPTNCVQDCQAQNRVRGRFVVLGFPFPVPADSRLTPRFRRPLIPPAGCRAEGRRASPRGTSPGAAAGRAGGPPEASDAPPGAPGNQGSTTSVPRAAPSFPHSVYSPGAHGGSSTRL